ncbi:MAG: hypothetical protein ACPHVR_04390, partial [Poseidonia sp.]
AQQRWDDAIGYAWSLSALGLVLGVGSMVVVERPLEDGTWPVRVVNDVPKDTVDETSRVKSHHVKKKGSWKRREEE